MADDLSDIIDITRYPLHRHSSSTLSAAIDSAKTEFAASGAVQLNHFLVPAVVTQLVQGAMAAKADGHRMRGLFPAYSDAMSDRADETLPADHPARLKLPASHVFIPGDLISDSNPLRVLYRHDNFQRFLRCILDVPALHPLADTMGSVNLLVYEPDDLNGWHFDTTDFVISLMLQPASDGGAYQYLPDMRSNHNANLPAISWRMQNPDAACGLQSSSLEAGSLFIFKGKYTLHRVTRVAPGNDRVVAILSYHPTPGQQISSSSKRAMYGREQSRPDPLL